MTEPAIVERVRQAVDQAVQIIERRINELGLVEPLIQRQGTDRILVQVPGLGDPKRLIELVGKTAKLDFRMVDETMTAEQARGEPGAARIGNPLWPEPRRPLALRDRKTDSCLRRRSHRCANAASISAAAKPVVNFRFNSAGRGASSQRRPPRTLASALPPCSTTRVITAPVIREPILQGSGQISGSFTVESANDLAILLRAGALPAPLTIIEQRVVGAGLGQDSITKGKEASLLRRRARGRIMVVVYGLFGVFASVAVAINVSMIFGVLSLLNATLTLPGIIGIVLTIGIAVDSNVLIYERIREEVRTGRTPISAIDAGFTRALATILDLQHHDLHCRRRVVLHRYRSGSRLCGDAWRRDHHDRLHRIHPHEADGRLVGPVGAPAEACNLLRPAPCACIPRYRCCVSSPTIPNSISCASGASAFGFGGSLDRGNLPLLPRRAEFRHRLRRRHAA